MSFTVSEIPRDTIQNEIPDNLEDIDEQYKKMKEDQKQENISFEDQEVLSPQKMTQMNSYKQLSAVKRPKSTLQSGRSQYKGRIFNLDQITDRDVS